MILPACPHCGDQVNEFYINARSAGAVEVWFDQTGKYYETTTDRAYTKIDAGVVRCGKCLKIRRDLKLAKDELKVTVNDAK